MKDIGKMYLYLELPEVEEYRYDST